VSEDLQIVVLDPGGVTTAADELAGVLVDCVAAGASVSFMHPFGREAATTYFHKVAGEISRGETILLAARHRGRIVGTVQLGVAMPPNQPHRADVKKLLVHRDARRHGVGAALMTAVEHAARRHDRTLLVLDTAAGSDAERLYGRGGWMRVGVIPGYALWPDGLPCDTVIFCKRLQAP
jgi:GNAT superfamily N-acetyltransferase